MEFYAFLKSALADDTGFPDTILHIHGGLLILVLARVISRRSLATFIPFSVVLVLELVNEVVDRINHGAWLWPDTLSDIGNTLFWPLVISLGTRFRPPLLMRTKADKVES